MIDRRNLLITSGAAGLAFGLGPAGGGHAAQPLAALLDAYAEQMLQDSPEMASSLGLDTGVHAALKSRLDDRSWASVLRDHDACRTRLTQLAAIDPKSLSDADAVNHAAVVYANQLGAEAGAFDYGDNTLAAAMGEAATPYVVNQQAGDFNGVPDFLDSQHKIDTAGDADAYLARLEALARALDQETERVRKDAGLGVIPPDFLLTTTLDEMAAFRATPASASSLTRSLAGRAAAKALKGDYAGQAAAIVGDKIYPALDRQIAALTAAKASAGHDAGVWRLPDGEAYYAWLLKVGTSTPMTADEIHAMGLEQTRAITARMDAILRQQGLTQGGVGERMTALGKDPPNLFPDSDAGRAALVAYLNTLLSGIRRRMPQLSRLNLKADVVVKRVPVEIETGASLGYMSSGPLDGSRPSIYYINLHDMADWPRYSLPTLTYHETLPGHAWAGAYVNESHALPLVRVMLDFNAYDEGWALYSEQMADEIGLYDDDPLGRLGYLQEQNFRGGRLVVDTGLHAKRWTREQAIAWMIETTGESPRSIASEIDRYCAGPGQACGYKVGQTEILRLRETARAARGARFDLRDFNDAVITCGSVPLTVLADVIGRYAAG
jgi:uncharacterized protein (DUF885 family)